MNYQISIQSCNLLDIMVNRYYLISIIKILHTILNLINVIIYIPQFNAFEQIAQSARLLQKISYGECVEPQNFLFGLCSVI